LEEKITKKNEVLGELMEEPVTLKKELGQADGAMGIAKSA